MSCPCDISQFPKALAIPAGLHNDGLREARALGLFPQWRGSLLGAIGREPALDDWRAREPHDLGLMLTEMGAYVCDLASFYDALLAAESYLGTAALPDARRRLVALLGYLPRPAVAARVQLAAEADGRQPLTVPAGTAFRSGEFDGNPPQVFELEQDARIDPRINRLEVARVRATHLPATLDQVLALPASVRLRPGAPVVLDFAGTLAPARVASVADQISRAGSALRRVGLTPALAPPAGTAYAATRLLAPGAATGLWKLGNRGGDAQNPISNGGATVLLEGRVPIRAGDILLFEQDAHLAARKVTTQRDVQRAILDSLTSSITDSANKTSTLVSPAIRMGITELTLDAALPAEIADVNRVLVHYALSPAASLSAPIKNTLEQTDPVGLPGLIDPPRVGVEDLLLEDVHGEGVATTGALDAAGRSAALDASPAWGRTLTAPVRLFGNVLEASRGETVVGERLGFGDAALPFQTFKLKKKPLTYLSGTTDTGQVSTLRVRVGGILWQEVASFYGVAADARVYTVRHDEAGDAHVRFGGGARLPTGAQVAADYRFGAGAAVPPAGSVKQLARPLPGLKSVRNILPAYGGDDAESPEALAAYAPRSALLLGRAVSLADLEAATAQAPGVKAARAAWRWDEAGLRPAAVIHYVGDAQLVPSLRARLAALAEPDAPIAVVRSLPESARLLVDLEADPDRRPEDVAAAVLQVLYAPVTLPGTGGLLRPERLGPDGILYLSHVVAAIMGVDGVAALRSLSFNGVPFTDTGKQPLAGRHFDFGEGGVSVNGVTL